MRGKEGNSNQPIQPSRLNINDQQQQTGDMFSLTCCVLVVESVLASGTEASSSSSSSNRSACGLWSGDGVSLGGGRLGRGPGLCTSRVKSKPHTSMRVKAVRTTETR